MWTYKKVVNYIITNAKLELNIDGLKPREIKGIFWNMTYGDYGEKAKKLTENRKLFKWEL